MSRFGPVCRNRVDMMSGYSTSRSRGQMRPDCVDRAIRIVGTEQFVAFLPTYFDGKWRQRASLKCWCALLTHTRPGGPQSEHTLPLKNL